VIAEDMRLDSFRSPENLLSHLPPVSLFSAPCEWFAACTNRVRACKRQNRWNRPPTQMNYRESLAEQGLSAVLLLNTC
jgi:hypothetical protein